MNSHIYLKKGVFLGKRLILEEDLHFTVFREIYQRYSEPKTMRRAFSLLEGAIRSFEKQGLDGASFSSIAKHCKVTRPLMKHYFTDYAEIRVMALKYIRILLQREVVDAISKPGNPAERLQRYIEAHFHWCTSDLSHARVWLAFLATSSRVDADRALNTVAVQAGTHRLIQFLSSGREQGIFKHQNDVLAARMLQTLMLGGLVAVISEEIEDHDEFIRAIVTRCLQWVQGGSI